MTEQTKVSIVIPAYNVEKYVARGIDSCLDQTYQAVEIVIVDDGSTDNTLQVIRQYSDPRMVVVTQENRGVSAARNHALQKISGEYVLFLDSDDWLEKECVQEMLAWAKKYPDSLVCADRYFAYEQQDGTITRERQREPREVEWIDRNKGLQNIGTGVYNLQSSCYKLFSVDKIRELGLAFSEDIHHGEDGLFVFQYLAGSKGAVFTTEPYWNILERAGSATMSGYNSKWLSIVQSIERMKQVPDLDEECQKALNGYMVTRMMLILRQIAKTAEHNHYRKDYTYVQKVIKQYMKTDRKQKMTFRFVKRWILASMPLSLLYWVIRVSEKV